MGDGGGGVGAITDGDRKGSGKPRMSPNQINGMTQEFPVYPSAVNTKQQTARSESPQQAIRGIGDCPRATRGLFEGPQFQQRGDRTAPLLPGGYRWCGWGPTPGTTSPMGTSPSEERVCAGRGLGDTAAEHLTSSHTAALRAPQEHEAQELRSLHVDYGMGQLWVFNSDIPSRSFSQTLEEGVFQACHGAQR